MSLISVVKQLRRLPVLAGNVAGGAIEDLQNYQFASLPAAYVVPLDDTVGPNESMTGLYQTATQRIGIIVIFSNAPGVLSTNDRRGQMTAELYEITKASIFKAILNWNPYSIPENQNIPGSNTNAELPDLTDPWIGHAARGFYYDGCGLITYGLDRTAYEYRFCIDVVLTDDADGWQLDGVPLERIFVEYVNPETGTILVTQDFPDLWE